MRETQAVGQGLDTIESATEVEDSETETESSQEDDDDNEENLEESEGSNDSNDLSINWKPLWKLENKS